jgi:hypothetical protein
MQVLADLLSLQTDDHVDATKLSKGRGVLSGDGWRKDAGQKNVCVYFKFLGEDKPKDPRPGQDYIKDWRFG